MKQFFLSFSTEFKQINVFGVHLSVLFSKMAATWPRSNIKLISFSIERTKIHDFDGYFRVFRHSRHSSVARKHPDYCIVGQIQNGRYLFNVKPLIYNICDRIEADS